MSSSVDLQWLDVTRAPAWVRGALLAFVVLLKIGFNAAYFNTYGWLASPGADIWYYIGVAQGEHRLFLADPLQWMLPLFGGLRPEILYFLLVLLSNGLDLLSILLLYAALREFHFDDRAALWGCAIYACLSTSIVFTTGSFHHQMTSLPVIVALMGCGNRFLKAQNSRDRKIYAGAIALLTLLGLSMGPDVFVLWVVVGPCLGAWYCRKFFIRFIRDMVGTLVLTLCFTILFLARSYILDLGTDFAEFLRGIDLNAQRELQAADLMPLTWKQLWGIYSWMNVPILFIALWAWERGRIAELSLFLAGILFATFAARFYFIAELGLAVLICWMLARGLKQSPDWQGVVGAFLLLVFLGFGIVRGAPCLYPGTLPAMLESVREDPRPNKLVLCSPTYGFLIEAVTRAAATSDMHQIDPRWMEYASKPVEEALPFFRRHGVTHIFFTSYDLREGTQRDKDGKMVSGIFSSGGLDPYLSKLSQEDLQKSLVYQVLYGKEPVAGTTIVSAKTDAATQIRAVLLHVNSRAEEAPKSEASSGWEEAPAGGSLHPG